MLLKWVGATSSEAFPGLTSFRSGVRSRLPGKTDGHMDGVQSVTGPPTGSTTITTYQRGLTSYAGQSGTPEQS